MDFCFDGGGGFFFTGMGGFFKLLMGDGCLFYLGVGWCSNYWKIMGGGVQTKINLMGDGS